MVKKKRVVRASGFPNSGPSPTQSDRELNASDDTRLQIRW